MSGIDIIIDETAGIKIPQFFADHCKTNWSNIDSDDLVVL